MDITLPPLCLHFAPQIIYYITHSIWTMCVFSSYTLCGYKPSINKQSQAIFTSRPDMTFAVDWALRTNHISILYSQGVASRIKSPLDTLSQSVRKVGQFRQHHCIVTSSWAATHMMYSCQRFSNTDTVRRCLGHTCLSPTNTFWHETVFASRDAFVPH